jgi:hypothetical protein
VFTNLALENLLEFSDYLQEGQSSSLEDMLQDFQEACGITPVKKVFLKFGSFISTLLIVKDLEIKYPIEFQEIVVDDVDFQPRMFYIYIFGLVWFGLVWFGLVWLGLVLPG